jgi:outer membrane protein assembly factor BamB
MLRPIVVLLATTFPLSADDWPQFRGPTGDGLYTGPKLPTEWGPDKNVAWKTPIPGKGWSSPIVSKGRVYLTTAVPTADGDQSLRAICLNGESGKIEWNTEVFLQKKATAPNIHSKNSHASPTPTTDGERLYVHFGHMGTAALDLQGKVVWTRTKLYDRPVHGNGGSPILINGLLVFSCDGLDKQFVIALHAKDGTTAWQTPRKTNAGKTFSFSTPTVIDDGGKKLVLSVGSNLIGAYDAATGKEVWRFGFDGYSLIPKPSVGHGMVFFSTGYDSPTFQAVKLGGKGDVTGSHGAWTVTKVAPHTPSPLLVGNEVYLVSDRGLMSCVDAGTGDVVWQERVKGNYSASPIHADGRIYLTSEEGKGTLVAAGRKFEVLGEFDMKDKTFASFAAVDGALYIRTEKQLYKFAVR